MSFDWEAYIEVDETLLWKGQPDRRFRPVLHGVDLLVLPLSLPFFLMALVAVAMGSPLGVFFACLAGYFLFGRAVIDVLRRRRTHYAITDKRILRKHGGAGPRHLVHIGPDVSLDVALGNLTTIRFNRWVKGGTKHSIVTSIVAFNIQQIYAPIFLGYVAWHPELRLIREGKHVVRLLKSLIAEAAEVPT